MLLKYRHLVLVALLGSLLTGMGCSRKTGCPANEEVHVKANSKGELPMKRGSTNLFPKKMRKNRQ